MGLSRVKNEEAVNLVTLVMDMMNLLDHANFVHQEMGLILIFSIHSEF